MIVQELYASANKSRIQACKESIRDEYRYFYYDLSTSTINSDHTQPLLVTRHNVASGMVLVSQD